MRDLVFVLAMGFAVWLMLFYLWPQMALGLLIGGTVGIVAAGLLRGVE